MISEWRDEFFEKGSAVFQDAETPQEKMLAFEVIRLKTKIGDITMDNDLLYEKIARMEQGIPFRQQQAGQESSSKAKRGRKPVWSDEFILESVRALIADTEAFGFHGEGYRKLWARLRFKGITVDQERLRLLLGKHNLLAPHRCGKPKGPKAHTRTIIPIGANLDVGNRCDVNLHLGTWQCDGLCCLGSLHR